MLSSSGPVITACNEWIYGAVPIPSVACACKQTSAKMLCRTSIAHALNTRRRYFATKTKCTYNLKT